MAFGLRLVYISVLLNFLVQLMLLLLCCCCRSCDIRYIRSVYSINSGKRCINMHILMCSTSSSPPPPPPQKCLSALKSVIDSLESNIVANVCQLSMATLSAPSSIIHYLDEVQRFLPQLIMYDVASITLNGHPLSLLFLFAVARCSTKNVFHSTLPSQS